MASLRTRPSGSPACPSRPPTGHRSIGDLWIGTWIAALAVGALVWGLIAWASIAYRRKRHDEGLPEQVRYNIPIETMYTVVPLFIIGVLFFWTMTNANEVLAKESDPDVQDRRHRSAVVAGPSTTSTTTSTTSAPLRPSRSCTCR